MNVDGILQGGVRAAVAEPPVPAWPSKTRIALYSHDTMGIGHMRRNLLIAQALAAPPCVAATLLIAGAREANAFGLPAGADFLSLPALHKQADGQYRARHLELSLHELIELRARSIAAALEAFAPDVFIVDKVPRGAVNELDPALESIRKQGRTQCVLGLRDVLDDPATVRREWDEGGFDGVLRVYYDAVWVYGDPAVYDPAREYDFPPDVADKVRFTGYLDQRERTRLADVDGGREILARMAECPERLVLCMVGGGQDGGPLAEVFAETEFPPDTTGVILTGPFLPAEVQQRLSRRVAANPRLRFLGFVTDTDLLLERADRVIAMGGYNTVCEVLSYDKPALVVPRVHPRREQLIRAERLQSLGLLDVLHPDRLSPAALGEWLARPVRPRRAARECINLDGLAKLPRLLAEVLQGARGRACRTRPEGRVCHASR
jgi:predicted glycosyltransferase